MGDQIRTLTLKCPSCGSGLEVSPDMERFSCGYCGTEQMVQRRGGTVSLKLITAAISKVQVGTDKTAAELALVRLQQELTELDSTPFSPLKPRSEPPTPASCDSEFRTYLRDACTLFVLSFAIIFPFVPISNLGLFARIIIVASVVFVWWLIWTLIRKVLDIQDKANQAWRATWDAEFEKLNRPEKDRIQTARERILSQIAINKAIVGHADKGA